MHNFLEDLNTVQYDAVTHIEGPVLVIAGPGSGKTRVLTYRIAYMLQQGIDPSQILALTFTNKAAKEMKERIEKVAGSRAKSVWAGTFHSLFSRVLRMEAERIGFPQTFTIYDTEDSKSLVNTIIKEWNLNKEKYVPNAIRNRISSAKSNLLTPNRYADDRESVEIDKANQIPLFSNLYQEYYKRCVKAGAMDFDDLLLNFYKLLLEHPDTADKYRARFRYIMVDEFQDTNYLQYAILKKLVLYPGSPLNICAVGDDAQSIYAFRGATIDNILHFEKDFTGLKIYKLEQNYRSTKPIVEAANKIIANNKRQIKKTIWTDKAQGNNIKVIRAINDTEESRRVVDLIMELKNREHLSNNELAILYRTNAQSRLFEEQLRRYNIPYRVFGGLSFYQRKEVKDLLAYLRVVVNPRDNEALKRIINFPKRGIGDTTVDGLAALANEHQLTLWESLLQFGKDSRSAKSLEKFVSMIQGFMEKSLTLGAYDLALWVAQTSGLHSEYAADTTPEGISRKENIQALLNGIKEFMDRDEAEYIEDVEDKSLASYLRHITLLTDADEVTDDTPYISLMSVHAAKGLEFDAVFVVGLEELLFPSFMSIHNPEDIDEERRLFYVAITRARKYLHLTWAQMRYKYGQMKPGTQSRFLEELELESDSDGTDSSQTKITLHKSGVQGLFKKPLHVAPSTKHIDPANFEPSPLSMIKPGKKVLHPRFGSGEVLSVDGHSDNLVATIRFSEIDNAERKLALKFARLQVLN